MGSCSARRHLRGADFAIYDAAMQLTARSRANGDKAICNASRATLSRMTAYSERTVADARKRLVASGWLRPLKASWIDDQRRTGAAGHFKTPEFQVLCHEEWAMAQPGRCISDREQSTVHGDTVDGHTVDGKTANTVRGRTTGTVRGNLHTKPYGFKPKNQKPKKACASDEARSDSLCSLKSKNVWEFTGLTRNVSSAKVLETVFESYKRNHPDGRCDCDPVWFLNAAKKFLGEKCPKELLDKLASATRVSGARA